MVDYVCLIGYAPEEKHGLELGEEMNWNINLKRLNFCGRQGVRWGEFHTTSFDIQQLDTPVRCSWPNFRMNDSDIGLEGLLEKELYQLKVK